MIKEGINGSPSDSGNLLSANKKIDIHSSDFDNDASFSIISENLNLLKGSVESVNFLKQIVERPNLFDQNDIYLYKRNLARLRHEAGEAN